MTDQVIFRGDANFANTLTVTGDFDVNNLLNVTAASGAVNFQGNLSLNSTQFLDASTGALPNIGTVGCGAIT